MRDDPAALHGGGCEALADHALGDNDISLGESGVDGGVVDGEGLGVDPGAAGDERNGEVVLEFGVDGGGLALHREFGVDDGGQFLDLDDDGVRGVSGEVAIGRDNNSHRVAYVVHLLRRDRPKVGVREGADDGLGCDYVVQLRARHDQFDAGQGLRGGGVDACDAAVGDIAAAKGDVQHALQLDVVDEDAQPLDDGRVFRALDALPDHLAGCGASFAGHCFTGHRAAPASAAFWMALTMCW